jgi:hypothetical protein
MATLTAEKVEQEYVRAMGSELGIAAYRLHNALVQLHVEWQQFEQLFGDTAETVALLNRTAGLFFRTVQDALLDGVLLGSARLMDPAASGSNRNLTLRTLPTLITDSTLRVEVEALCAKALDASTFAREHRNKRIAHADSGHLLQTAKALSPVTRNRVSAMLEAFDSVLNRIDLHYREATFCYDFADDTGARLLVDRLGELERLRKMATGS